MRMTPQTLAATLALFDGDADEATVVARIVALRQDPDWRVALHNGSKRCAIVLTNGPTGEMYRVYLDKVTHAEGVVWRRAA
jgi:hypothetical protein